MWGWKRRGGHSCEACDHLCEVDFFQGRELKSARQEIRLQLEAVSVGLWNPGCAENLLTFSSRLYL